MTSTMRARCGVAAALLLVASILPSASLGYYLDEPSSCIVVHLVTPEDLYIGYWPIFTYDDIDIYVGNVLALPGADIDSGCCPIEVPPGKQTIRAVWNGIEVEKQVHVEPFETKNVKLVFPRTEFPISSRIPQLDLTATVYGRVDANNVCEGVSWDGEGKCDGREWETGYCVYLNGSKRGPYAWKGTTHAEMGDWGWRLVASHDCGRALDWYHCAHVYEKIRLDIPPQSFSYWYVQVNATVNAHDPELEGRPGGDFKFEYTEGRRSIPLRSYPGDDAPVPVQTTLKLDAGERIQELHCNTGEWSWHQADALGSARKQWEVLIHEFVMSSVPYDLEGEGTPYTEMHPPIASFSFWPENPAGGEAVRFDASSSKAEDGAVLSYLWDFGEWEGRSAVDTDCGQVVYHAYDKPGKYTVTLVVTDNRGLVSSTRRLIGGTEADFAYSPDVPCVDEEVRFEGSVSGDPNGEFDSYSWTFGDGTSGEGKVVRHTYRAPGAYKVAMVVSSQDASADPIEKTITVAACDPNPDPDITVSFFDKDNPDRSVTGAAADGCSEVIVSIENLPEGTSPNEVVISPDPNDGRMSDEKPNLSGGVFTQTYVAPEFFVREGHREADLAQGQRPIDLHITVKERQVTPASKLLLIKPPVVLMHGLWSNYECWWDLGTKLVAAHGYDEGHVLMANYANDVYFERNRHVIGNTAESLLRCVHEDGFVAKKVDVVAHSMGGLLTKLYGDESYIRSVTTVGTPHYGSECAELLWSLVDDRFWSPPEMLYAALFRISGHPATDGAIEDLRVAAGKDCSADRLGAHVPICVIAGISPPTNHSSVGFISLLEAICRFSHVLQPGKTLLDLNQLLFGGEENDWVVTASSQKGGWSEALEADVVWHCSEPEDESVQRTIVAFLHRTASTSPPVASAKKRTSKGKGIPRRKLAQAEIGSSPGEVKINRPDPRQVFQPGDTVTVEIEVSNGDAMVLVGTSTGSAALLDEKPFAFELQIPIDAVGAISILAGARDDEGFIGSDEIAIQVESTAQLTGLTVSPDSGVLNLAVGTQLPLVVTGTYTDSVERSVSTSTSGTSYSSSDPNVVDVSDDGLLTVRSKGQATVTIQNSGATEQLTVIGEVVAGPRILVTPGACEFASVELGSSETRTVTIQNVGAEALQLGALSISGPDSDEFELNNDDCSGQTLTSLETRTVDVTFVPASEGGKAAELAIPSNDPDAPTCTTQLRAGAVQSGSTTDPPDDPPGDDPEYPAPPRGCFTGAGPVAMLLGCGLFLLVRSRKRRGL